MKFLFYKALFINLLLVGACAAPDEPAALKSNSSELTDKKAKKDSGAEGALAVNYGGANVGDDETRAAVKKCIDQGKFYERLDNPKPTCTNYALAQISCTDSTITSIMDTKDKSTFESFMKGNLAGYTLDQCLDCSSPVGNPYCEGRLATKVKDPGVRLFLVKQSGMSIEIKTVYIFK